MKDINSIDAMRYCNSSNVVQGEKYRFTILTPQLLRLEYSYHGLFEDNPTQIVQNRKFEEVAFQVREKEDSLEIETDSLILIYDKEEFSRNGLCIKVKGNLSAYHSVWYYGSERADLGGTARTLDNCDGEIPLDSGVISRNGYAILDDSKSFPLSKDGKVMKQRSEGTDLYFFGYGREYLKCLRDYFKLTGPTPMLPRYALGNWWSRYYRYTQKEYQELIEKFEDKGVPFSVAVIDMDWHLVEIDPKYGSGWTGYTWNEELFPDYKAFLDWLHDHNLHVTLNEHPAEGVRAHEKMYLSMAKELGYDFEKEVPIHFDITDERFTECYFKYLHHPYEKEGVDFWWIDWQQGSHCKIEGLDPLWLLNHLHFNENARSGKRGLILSRYAGPGSHRYPIGFSGDSIMSWESLAFQPYFTATASNIGYCWWSHDIGGHMLGIRNDELAVRWLQFGVFSPIMRLHSSASPFNSKEPWEYGRNTELIMTSFLRLRHRLVPYLYTMNYLCHREGYPLMQPMYYQYPNNFEAYEVRNQYFYGSELIVNPITAPISSRLGLSNVVTWLPEGTYIDCMTGLIYRGNRFIKMYRSLEQIPVLAKAGAIVPLVKEEQPSNSIENPRAMDIYIYAGADGQFTLYEDDGNSMEFEQGKCVTTNYTLGYEEGTFMISKAIGDVSLIPAMREYTLHFVGLRPCEAVEVLIDDEVASLEVSYQKEMNELRIEKVSVAPDNTCVVKFKDKLELAQNDTIHRIYKLLSHAQIELLTKERVFDLVRKDSSAFVLSEIMALNLETELVEAISEILLAY
ncbi:MAG TPA: TIM-barrel domain-containing protein [Lachnospiraceae bacterium]|nr:TIM-barrel domain-containing protein [Lachnospiraceae bacterium]